MNDLLTVCENNGQQVVNARDLHVGLGVGRDFSNWIKDRIEKYGFCEGVDYETRSPNLVSEMHGGQNRIDYFLTVPMAKELAMVENNEKGREVRQYLIKIEQAWNTPELVFARALQQANELITRQSSRIAELLPKAEFFDQVASSRSAISMREVAATLNIAGWGRNKIFQLLRDEKILDENNLPYRAYQDRGYFRVVENAWTAPDGERRINLTTLVYQRGLDYIRKTIKTKAVPAMAIAQ
jgi:anti-repressor protein